MSAEALLNGRVNLHCGDSRDVLKGIPDNSIDSVVTDPPYALVSIVKRFGGANAVAVKVPEGGSGAYARASSGFMGKTWDTGETAFAAEFWAECLRVLKPGGHVVAFSGTRTVHRMVCAIEDAGFEIRDSLQWIFGSGFPKSHDVSKGIDKAAGAERQVLSVGAAVKRMIPGADQNDAGWEKNNGREFIPSVTAPATPAAVEWQGWGTALKPANEPICLARKPLSEKTVVANVLKWGTGAINIDGCRVESNGGSPRVDEASQDRRYADRGSTNFAAKPGPRGGDPAGRWPANVIHDGSDEVLEGFPDSDGAQGIVRGSVSSETGENGIYGRFARVALASPRNDSGSASRFFYSAKADAEDRAGSKHPTVKPVSLMRWLSRLVTPPGGTVLDPFAGTGTTGEAAFLEGFTAILVERETEYQSDIRRRMKLCMAGPDERRREAIKAKVGDVPFEAGSLFA